MASPLAATAVQKLDVGQEIEVGCPCRGSIGVPGDQLAGEVAAAAEGTTSPAVNTEVTADSSTTAANRRVAASLGILSPNGSEPR
jgi:hypothetical protein